MARTVRDSKLETRNARSELKAQGKPYYRLIDPGFHLGYRRLSGGAGKWVVRHYAGEQSYIVQTIATADDLSDSNGVDVLSFAEAQERAREWRDQRSQAAAGMSGPYTVNKALDDYLEYLRSEGRAESAIKDAKYRIDAFIRPTLGRFEVADLKPDQLRRWRADLAKAAPRLRTNPEETQQHRKTKDERARKATANRILTTLKAALNHAFDEELVSSNKAWGRRVKPFENADAARVRYLTIAEAKRLINTCDPDFRRLVQGALLSGGRYGQVAALKVSDFNATVGTIDFRSRKGRGKENFYSCVLSKEGIRFFEQVCAGRGGSDLIFMKENGEAWGKGHQIRNIAEACGRASIKPKIGFHQLRHTWASHAVMNGTPLLVVAKNLGHSDTRMVEKHYGHLAPSYVAAAIRAGAPKYGFKADRKVRLLEVAG
jgi:integrase